MAQKDLRDSCVVHAGPQRCMISRRCKDFSGPHPGAQDLSKAFGRHRDREG